MIYMSHPLFYKTPTDYVSIPYVYNTATNKVEPAPVPVLLKIVSATATADDGNNADNVLDSSDATRWSAQGVGQKLYLDLGGTQEVTEMEITWYQTYARIPKADVQLDDGVNIPTNADDKPTTKIVFPPNSKAKVVTVIGNGNSVNDWNSITSVRIYGRELVDPTIPTPEPPTTDIDSFGIKMLNPTISGGRVFSLPTNLRSTRVRAVSRMGNTECVSQGDGGQTPGTQYWKMDGTWPRLYVYDAQRTKKWDNVEMTCYFMKVSASTNSISGIVMAARGIHESGGNNAQVYGIKHQYSNDNLSFYKEQVHPIYKFSRVGTYEITSNKWLGYKLVLRTKSNGHVVMRVYMDLTDGANGGDWKLLGTYTDTGALDGNKPIKEGTSCFVRTDSVTDFRYKKLSIRTIAPEP